LGATVRPAQAKRGFRQFLFGVAVPRKTTDKPV